MLNDMQKDVLAFHQFFGLPWNSQPANISEARRSLRRSLIAEENAELWQAVARFDMIETADGIADLLYVTLGTRVEFGFPLLAPLRLLPAQKIAFPDAKAILAYKLAFTRPLSRLARALSGPTMLLEIDAATYEVARAALGLSAAFGLPIFPIWNAVHASNMTKAARPNHSDDCPLAREHSQPCNCGAVLYREDGKLKKGAGFRPPDVAAILAAAGYRPPEAPKDVGGTFFEERPK